MRIAIFASGSGTNFQAIVDAVKARTLSVEIACLICDRADAYVFQRAEREQVPSLLFSPKSYESKEAFEREVVRELMERKIDFIVLAGYMRLIGPTLLQAFRGRIINIHPSLLPSFPGKDGIGDALQYGVKVTGITIHFVDEGMDTGPIIAQVPVPVLDGDTKESLAERIHKEEHGWYPKVIQWIADGKVQLDGHKVMILK
jgi:phosphoribosylglycinamide formyltransferase-1